MAVDGGYGPKGYPKFIPGGGFEDWVDLEAVGQFAAKVGNRVVGTAADRAALSASTTAPDQSWEGLEFYETDTKSTYLYQGAWLLWDSPPVIFGAASASRPRATYLMRGRLVGLIGVAGKPVGYGIGTLPAGFRPTGDHYYQDAGIADASRLILVRANGSVEYTAEPAHDVTFNIWFQPAA